MYRYKIILVYTYTKFIASIFLLISIYIKLIFNKKVSYRNMSLIISVSKIVPIGTCCM